MLIHPLLHFLVGAIYLTILLEVASLDFRNDALAATVAQADVGADDQALGHEVLVLGNAALKSFADIMTFFSSLLNTV